MRYKKTNNRWYWLKKLLGPKPDHWHSIRRETGMARIVTLQFFVMCITAIIAAMFSGKTAGVSALLGGVCYAVPNALFALRLFAATRKSGAANPMTFFAGEFIKIFMTIASLAAVVWLYHDLHWLAFLTAFIVVMKSYLILLFKS